MGLESLHSNFHKQWPVFFFFFFLYIYLNTIIYKENMFKDFWDTHYAYSYWKMQAGAG